MDMKNVLERAGLAGNEAKVYLALLDLGSALAGEITKKSGVNRTNVYDALDKLIEKGLVSFVIQANRKYFEAGPVERLIKYIEEKENELKTKNKVLQKAIPELDSRRKLGKEPLEATIYKGKKGLKSVAEDVLKTKKEMFVFGAEGKFMEYFRHYAWQWHKRRRELKIPIRIIYNEKIRKKKQHVRFGITKMRFSQSMYDTPANTWIYGDKVAVVVWSEQPIVTLMRSKEIAQSYKQFFNILWKDSKP